MACAYFVRVDLNIAKPQVLKGRPPRSGRRHFIVCFDADGEVLRIKERKANEDVSYWVPSSHPMTDLPKQIIAVARAKLRAEHRDALATP